MTETMRRREKDRLLTSKAGQTRFRALAVFHLLRLSSCLQNRKRSKSVKMENSLTARTDPTGCFQEQLWKKGGTSPGSPQAADIEGGGGCLVLN